MLVALPFKLKPVEKLNRKNTVSCYNHLLALGHFHHPYTHTHTLSAWIDALEWHIMCGIMTYNANDPDAARSFAPDYFGDGVAAVRAVIIHGIIAVSSRESNVGVPKRDMLWGEQIACSQTSSAACATGLQPSSHPPPSPHPAHARPSSRISTMSFNLQRTKRQARLWTLEMCGYTFWYSVLTAL